VRVSKWGHGGCVESGDCGRELVGLWCVCRKGTERGSRYG